MPSDTKRKLAAIVFADIEGYTSLMEHDEDLARTLVQKFRIVNSQIIGQFGGTIINFYGDGCVSMFESSVHALQCAKQLQHEFHQDPVIPVRIGVHSGDIYLEDENIYGDGVNIASRIQSMGVPGSVLFSERILKDVRNQKEIKSSRIGIFHLKNVDEPIEIFALEGPGLSVPSLDELRHEKLKSTAPKILPYRKRWIGLGILFVLVLLSYVSFQLTSPTVPGTVSTAEKKLAIAVLPFADLSPNRDQGYFGEGIADEILTHLSNIRSLKVMARTSSFTMRDAPVKVIRDSLGVDYVVEGTLKKEGDHAIISVRLIDARDESSQWAERFEKRGSGIIEVQRDIARIIATRLDPGIPELEINKKMKVSTHHLEAFELYSRAKEIKIIYHDTIESVDLLKQAVKLDPDFAEAHALLAWKILESATVWDGIAVDSGYQEAMNSIDKAIRLRPDNSEFYLILGAIRFYLEWNFEDAERQLEKAIGVGSWPESPTSYCFCAYIHLFNATKRFEKALQLYERVIEIDPAYHRRDTDLGLYYYYNHKWREAELKFKKCLKEHVDSGHTLAIMYILENKLPSAIEVLKSTLEYYGNDPRTWAILAVATYKMNHREDFQEIVDKLMLRYQRKEKFVEDALAVMYAGIGENQQAIIWLERAFLARSPEMMDLQTEPFFEGLRDDPRFQALLRGVGFN